MSEKSWELSPPINFETKFPLFTFISTYLVFVRFFSATLYEEKFYFSEGRHFLNADGSDFVTMVVAFGDDGRH